MQFDIVSVIASPEGRNDKLNFLTRPGQLFQEREQVIYLDLDPGQDTIGKFIKLERKTARMTRAHLSGMLVVKYQISHLKIFKVMHQEFQHLRRWAVLDIMQG